MDVEGEETSRLTSAGADRPLRRDAEENRERLLAAAVTSVLRHGSHVPMTRIAEEAGLGIGTLYRRYPTRESLLEALQQRAFRLVIDMVKDVERLELTGIESLRVFLERTVAHGSQLVMPYHGAPISGHSETSRLEGELHGRIDALIERGVRDGTVRPDLTMRDLVIFGSLVAIALPTQEQDWPQLMERQIALFLHGASQA